MIDNMLYELSAAAVDANASDIHLTVDQPPFMRQNGQLQPIMQQPLSERFLEECLASMVNDDQQDLLSHNYSIDFSWTASGRRFRGNAYFQRGHLAIALRLIPDRIPSLIELKLPPIMMQMIDEPLNGLLLFTGKTGSGKSTSIAAFINALIHRRSLHVLTLEDPIEYEYSSPTCMISQREFGRDFMSFPSALRAALREMPDILLVGEIRDAETMRVTIEAAAAGIFVIGTLHTRGASETAMRVESMFPADQRDAIRDQFADVLHGIFSQVLVPAKKGGRLNATEVLLATSSVRSLIRQGKYTQLINIMLGSQDIGMKTMESAMHDLVIDDLI